MSTPEQSSAEQLVALYLRFDQALADADAGTAPDTATAIAELSVEAIPGVEQASISEKHRGKIRTIAFTGDVAVGGDLLQYELGSGPCVEALTCDAVYRTDDVAADRRWPELARRATSETGAVSILSIRLPGNDVDRPTGLNLYSTQRAAFDDTSQMIGTVLATHSARVLITAGIREEAANLRLALDSNREIGTAIGILMATHSADREHAFTLLRIASQNSHRKLIDIATHVIDSGQLPTDG